jgi:2,3-dihydroxyethylbenzene 1,2-dioxygenase
MKRVTQLGYLGIDVSDVPGWQRFATDVLGLASNGTGEDGTLFLRMDEYHHRLALHRGGRDDLAYAGWKTGTKRRCGRSPSGCRRKASA